MKTIVSYIVAGLTGGMIVLSGNFLYQKINPQAPAIPANQVSWMDSPFKAPNVSFDFVTSAQNATPSVVGIVAEESDEQVNAKRKQKRGNDPFSDFFSFEDFFGGNFYQPRKGSGSGVIYSADGYIITNNHVVEFADKIVVTDSEGKTYDAVKIGTDETTDLAVIKINGVKNLTPIKFGDSDKVKVGEWALAVGNPFGYLSSTVTAGIVSAKGRKLDIIPNEKAIEEFIQTDAAINPGNSGGALVNLTGELIGINTAIATPTGVFAGYSFAIPVNLVKKVIKDIVEKGGNIERTGLGVAGYDVNDDLVSEFNLKLKSNKGFYIDEVVRKSAAQFGGLLPGDVIISIDDKIIQNYDDIDNAMKLNKVGDKVNIKVNRNGKEMTLPVQLRKSL